MPKPGIFQHPEVQWCAPQIPGLSAKGLGFSPLFSVYSQMLVLIGRRPGEEIETSPSESIPQPLWVLIPTSSSLLPHPPQLPFRQHQGKLSSHSEAMLPLAVGSTQANWISLRKN